jgi:hypothetical protein
MMDVGHGLLWSEPAVGIPHSAVSSTSDVRTIPAAPIQDSEREIATFCFGGSVDGSSSRSLPPAEQDTFRADFCRELASVSKWAAVEHWRPRVVPQLQVFVADEYKISKSLVPAWYGHRGHMEFPARRVVTRKAAIAHELVHVFFPNGNRLLAEGLALYLQAKIGGNPAFPNFGRPLHELARHRLREAVPDFTHGDPKSLDKIQLAELDRIATPGPLALKVGHDFYGEEPRGQAFIYPIAGSFVEFLIEMRGTEAFRMLFMRTPLVPLERNGGSPDRWIDVYGHSLADLELEWKALIARGGLAQVCEDRTSKSDRCHDRTES